jgi:predicted nucleotidyltransferase
MTTAPGIVLPEAEIAAICRRHQVRELSLFGSAVRGEMRPDSDIDLLVDYFPTARPSLFDLIGMTDELSDLLGRKVDLGVKRALKPRYKDHILAEAHVIYAA